MPFSATVEGSYCKPTGTCTAGTVTFAGWTFTQTVGSMTISGEVQASGLGTYTINGSMTTNGLSRFELVAQERLTLPVPFLEDSLSNFGGDLFLSPSSRDFRMVLGAVGAPSDVSEEGAPPPGIGFSSIQLHVTFQVRANDPPPPPDPDPPGVSWLSTNGAVASLSGEGVEGVDGRRRQLSRVNSHGAAVPF